MRLSVESIHLGEIKVIAHEVFEDHRGFFMEAYHHDHYRDIGLPADFAQLNHSGSVKNVVRGLHFQWEPPMGKLMRVIRGEAFLVAVDIRKGSPTIGQWYGEILSDKNRLQMWAPANFARGFAVLSDFAEIQYFCTGMYNGAAESGVLWNDPAIGVEWPVSEPILSTRDANAQTLTQWHARPESNHPNLIYSP